MTTASKINLIDLAGSERASQVLNSQVIKTAETAALRLKVTMLAWFPKNLNVSHEEVIRNIGIQRENETISQKTVIACFDIQLKFSVKI